MVRGRVLEGYRVAVDDAFRATSELYKAENYYPTNLWCMTRVDVARGSDGRPTQPVKYVPVDACRASSIKEMLDTYVSSLDVRSVEYKLEMDYCNKYWIGRNYYFPDSLRQQADVDKWFLAGHEIPAPMKDYLTQFWKSVVTSGYHFLQPSEVKCPRYEASGGVCLYKDPLTGEFKWGYVRKGPYWSAIQEGTDYWFELVLEEVPDEWLEIPISHLISDRYRNRELERLTVERPVIRKESGPGKVRWARMSSGNLYILGRGVMDSIQSGEAWGTSARYLGKALNAQLAAIKRSSYDDWHISTHGDDWMAWCPVCERFHSGDWSNFDLHVTARQMLASHEALYGVIRNYLTRDQQKLFYANAYLSVRAPTIWLWNRKGEASMSIRSTLGKARSGSGDFVMHNNAINWAALNCVLRNVHSKVGERRLRPCQSKLWWSTFSRVAAGTLGWVAKPEAQLTHPHGFIACRCYFVRERGFRATPSITSVVRNWVNPAYDPTEYPNSSRLWLVTRFRDVNKTLAWSPPVVAQRVADVLLDVARDAGVSDPWGMDVSNAEISRAVQQVVGLYSTSGFLESR